MIKHIFVTGVWRCLCDYFCKTQTYYEFKTFTESTFVSFTTFHLCKPPPVVLKVEMLTFVLLLEQVIHHVSAKACYEGTAGKASEVSPAHRFQSGYWSCNSVQGERMFKILSNQMFLNSSLLENN